MSDIMGHYTWSAMENCFIIDVYVIVVPWVSRVYGICTLSVVSYMYFGIHITTGRVQTVHPINSWYS